MQQHHLIYEDNYHYFLNPHLICEEPLVFILEAIGKAISPSVQNADQCLVQHQA
jgi:hypothetical protein